MAAPPIYYDLDEPQMSQLKVIEEILKNTRFPRSKTKNNYKKSTGYGESEGFGFIRRRGRVPGPCQRNRKYPELWLELQKLGALIPIQYDAVQVNLNCTCDEHRDKGNLGLSLLISGGDYRGGELKTEHGTFDAKYRGVLFDGSKIMHSNTPIIRGWKFTLVFFTIEITPRYKQFFPDNFRQLYPYYKDRFLETIPEHLLVFDPNGRKPRTKTKPIVENATQGTEEGSSISQV